MFTLKIVTPEKVVYEGKSSYLALVTDEGEQVILEGHEPYMSQITLGELTYKDEKGNTHPFAVSSGFLQVTPEAMYVLLDNAVYSKDIDLKAVQEAKARAEALLKTMTAKEDIRGIEAQIRLANLHIATSKKYRGSSMDSHEELPE